MKYIIKRSSGLFEQPIENSHLEGLHFFDRRYKSFSSDPFWEKYKKRNHDIHLDKDGYWCGTNNEPKEEWVTEVEDLHKFAEEYGTIILFPPDNAEGLWTIEIYDSYRE
jgi:hypothetical protein